MILNLPSLLLPAKHMNSNGVLPTYFLNEANSAASFKKSVSGREAYSVVLLCVFLLPSTRRTSAMYVLL